MGLRIPALMLVLVLAPSAAWPSTCLLVISGLSGSVEYAESFKEWSSATLAAAQAGGLQADQTIYLAEDAGDGNSLANGPSRAEDVLSAIDRLAGRCGPEGELWIVIYGHGSARNGESRVNLPGPDLSQADFAERLMRHRLRRIVVVNTTSSSSGFIEGLSATDRAIVTATRSVSQLHATTFGGAFAVGLGDERADTDKDDRVSLLEAFNYARLEVERRYREDGLMQVENALLDDSGDGAGSLEPSLDGDDGSLAAQIFLAEPASARASSPQMAAQLQRQEALQERVAELRRQRESLDPELYLEELEGLLLELARIDAELRRAAEDSP